MPLLYSPFWCVNILSENEERGTSKWHLCCFFTPVNLTLNLGLRDMIANVMVLYIYHEKAELIVSPIFSYNCFLKNIVSAVKKNFTESERSQRVQITIVWKMLHVHCAVCNWFDVNSVNWVCILFDCARGVDSVHSLYPAFDYRT